MEVSSGVIKWRYQVEVSSGVIRWSYQVALSGGGIRWVEVLDGSYPNSPRYQVEVLDGVIQIAPSRWTINRPLLTI